MTRTMGFFFVAIATVLMTFAIADDAQAFGRRGGSGGSHGSWGSNGGNGSWGSRGSFGGRFSRRNGSNGSHGGYSNGSCGSHGGNGGYHHESGYHEGEVIYGEESEAPEAPDEADAARHEAGYRGERMRDEQASGATTFESNQQTTAREADGQERVANRDSENRSGDANTSANDQQSNENRSDANAPQLSPQEQPIEQPDAPRVEIQEQKNSSSNNSGT